MSRIFLGVSFLLAGMAVQVIEMLTWHTGSSMAPLCAGTLVGAGGVLVIWHISDFVTTHRTTRLPGTPSTPAA